MTGVTRTHRREGNLTEALSGTGLTTFATCPPSTACDREGYLRQVGNVARWSEDAGCHGILVYTDNSLVDPWLVAQYVVTSTRTLRPLVAVQPVYMHPYWVAKLVASVAFLHGRQVCLNMVAGGFANDLKALNDETPHDRRYDRLVEYTTIVKDLLRGGPVTFEGEFYRVENLRLSPQLAPELFPEILMSGSSDAGLAAARRLEAVAVQYPKPVGEYERQLSGDGLARGFRVGMIARESSDEAWRIARERFPEDRRGQVTHKLAMKVSDSEWHRQLSDLGQVSAGDENPYWLVPFENYKTFCPYLVGTYERVSAELARYLAVGYRTLILDVPPNPEELEHIGVVLDRAQAEAGL